MQVPTGSGNEISVGLNVFSSEKRLERMLDWSLPAMLRGGVEDDAHGLAVLVAYVWDLAAEALGEEEEANILFRDLYQRCRLSR